MMRKLKGMRVAILVSDGFEQSELIKPRVALEDEGAQCDVVSPVWPRVKGWHHGSWGRVLTVDVPLAGADARDYEALLLPGGVMNPDNLRLQPKAIAFIRSFAEAGKPIASICHGPWTLIDAGAVRDKTMTSWPSLQADLRNAGAVWVDDEAVRDGMLVTSRKPDDIPAFNAKMIETFSEARLTPRQPEIASRAF